MDADQNNPEEWDDNKTDLSLMLTVSEIKAIPMFADLTDVEAENIAKSLYQYCFIVSQIVDNQQNMFDIGSKFAKKKTTVIQLNNSKNKAA